MSVVSIGTYNLIGMLYQNVNVNDIRYVLMYITIYYLAFFCLVWSSLFFSRLVLVFCAFPFLRSSQLKFVLRVVWITTYEAFGKIAGNPNSKTFHSNITFVFYLVDSMQFFFLLFAFLLRLFFSAIEHRHVFRFHKEKKKINK